MKRVFFSNDLKTIKKTITHGEGIFKYFVLDEIKNVDGIRKFLNAFPNCTEIDRQQLFDVKREKYNNKYLDLIAQLNKSNNSFYWWALNFPNRYPLFSELYNKVINLLIVADLIKETEVECLLIVTEDLEVVKQIRGCKFSEKLELVNKIKGNLPLWKIVKEFIPISIILVFLKTVLLKFYERRTIPIFLDSNRRYVVIRSLINRQTYSEGEYFRDAYFGELYKYLKDKNIPFIFFVTIWRPYLSNLRKVRAQNSSLKIVPLEYYLPFSKMMLCFVESLKRFYFLFKVSGKAEIEGIDISYLLKRELAADCRTHRFYSNLLVYFCTKALLSKIQVERFIYPFENRSWEQMSIYALKEMQENIRIIGYQHSSITPRHLNLILGDGESSIIPFPDYVITVGDITKNYLERTGCFPKQMIKIGCALRQKGIADNNLKARSDKGIKNILVVVTSSLDEYVKTLLFLNKGFRNSNSFDIHINPHPIFSIEKAVKFASPLNFNFEVEKDVPIRRALDWADAVLYTSSTVGLEALSLGIPVIYLDLGDFIRPDPLFEYSGLKWSVYNPDELLPTIEAINKLPDEVFENLQVTAREYAKRYFYPVTEENLKQFLIN